MNRTRRILVVDDDARNREILCEILQSLGYVPVPAGHGMEALEQLGPDIDLVLLDVMMPDMDGYEVAAAIRRDPVVREIPIIMVTVLDAREDRLQAVEAGANDFISKPVERLELKVRMDSLLKMKDARDALKRHLSDLEETVKRRTEALAESEKRFRVMFDGAQDLIFVKDSRFRYTEVNPAMIE
ncbi:MAG: response regulator, partial [Desulfomonilaceae bacterium]|nr:response regulator [Desulfomonilaceae bacterium]